MYMLRGPLVPQKTGENVNFVYIKLLTNAHIIITQTLKQKFTKQIGKNTLRKWF